MSPQLQQGAGKTGVCTSPRALSFTSCLETNSGKQTVQTNSGCPACREGSLLREPLKITNGCKHSRLHNKHPRNRGLSLTTCPGVCVLRQVLRIHHCQSNNAPQREDALHKGI